MPIPNKKSGPSLVKLLLGVSAVVFSAVSGAFAEAKPQVEPKFKPDNNLSVPNPQIKELARRYNKREITFEKYREEAIKVHKEWQIQNPEHNNPDPELSFEGPLGVMGLNLAASRQAKEDGVPQQPYYNM